MLDLIAKIFPKCFDLEAFRLEETSYAAMLVVNEKSYILWTPEGKMIKHGTGFLGRNQPKICHVFLDEMAEAILKGANTADVFRNYVDLSRFSFNHFTMNFTVSKQNYSSDTLYADLMSQINRARVKVRYGSRIKYVRTQKRGGYTPTFLMEPDDELDYEYYKVRLGMVYARLKMVKFNRKTEKETLRLMSQKNTMEEFF